MKTGIEQKRILVVDDHPLMREGIRSLINAQPDMIVCGEADDAASVFPIIRRTQPHCAVIDLGLKNSFGLELIKDLRRQRWEVPVLILSAHPEELFACAAYDAGAQGYVDKLSVAISLTSAIRTLLDGGHAFSEAVMKCVRQRSGSRGNFTPHVGIAGLSVREREVLTLIGQGFNNSEMCRFLKLDSHTIETYRSNLKTKLGLRNSAHLTVFAATMMQSGQDSAVADSL